jgi:HAMP domain-containing protein
MASFLSLPDPRRRLLQADVSILYHQYRFPTLSLNHIMEVHSCTVSLLSFSCSSFSLTIDFITPMISSFQPEIKTAFVALYPQERMICLIKMTRFYFGSLRVRLIILVLVAIIPSLIIILLTGREERRFSANNAKHDALQLAAVASGNQDLLIESTRQMLAGLARLPELRRGDSRACSALFADLLRQYRQYNNIVAVEPNGALWCSGVPAGGPTNYADRGWFPEVMRTRDFVIGEYVIGRVTKQPQSSIAYPILDAGGKVQRIIVTGFGLNWLNQFVAKTKLPPGSVLTVVDRNGTVLARTLEPDKWVGQTVKQAPIVNAILTQQNQGSLETTGIDGIKRLYAFAPLGTQTTGSVFVFIGIPTSVAYAQADWILIRNLIALGMASLLAFIVAWVGGNLFLLRRINVLLHTAKRLEDGDLSARTGIIYGPGELSKLAHAFDQMAESLEQRIAEREQAEQQLHDTLESLRKAVGATIQVMVSAVETRDPYTSGHQIRSADLARAIAVEMGLPQDKIDAIRMAGSIHDIGKLSIPAEILSKPTKLSEIEFSLIKEHARKGFEILKDVESPWPLAEMVHQHHERMDGSGYPRRLKGDDILMEARILAVADVVEAMASHRPYRPGLGIDVALAEIEKNRGISYDNAVAEACLRLFREKGYRLEGA